MISLWKYTLESYMEDPDNLIGDVVWIENVI